MNLKHLFFSVLLISTIAFNGPNVVEASFWDSLPIISQVKSLVQVIVGDVDGARQTQDNFLNQAPVVSQVKSAIEAIGGDDEAARRTQRRFLHGYLEPIADNTPVVGHIKGGIHMAVGDTERGEQILKGASSTTAAVLGGLVGGPAGAIAGQVAGDTIITAVDSIRNRETTNYGTLHYLDNFDKASPGEHFDSILGFAAEFRGAKGVKKTASKGSSAFGADEPRRSHLDDIVSERIESEGNKRRRPDAEQHNEIHNTRRQRTSAEERAPTHSSEISSSSNRRGIESLDLSNAFDMEIARATTKLPTEYAGHLEPIDFRKVNDVDGITNCYQCSLAAFQGKTVSQLNHDLGRQLSDRPMRLKGMKIIILIQ